jgi:hypothetical protein
MVADLQTVAADIGGACRGKAARGRVDVELKGKGGGKGMG